VRRSSPDRAAGRGFTLLELIVVVCVFATLFSVALDRMLRYQEDAERAVMRSSLAAFKTALQLKVAELLIERRGDQIAKLQGQNPVLWLEEAPSNYLGAFPAGEMRDKPPGNWYFDTREGDLVYLPRGAIFAAEGGKAPYELRFRVRIDYETVATPQGPARRLAAAVLAPVGPPG
jgi:prepilin-type N-terminal cleavage/methylation domain-containing protein